MVRYGFCIRTKSGQRVDNIQILAATLDDAERRLRQMYLQCVIIERREQSVPRPGDGTVTQSGMTQPRVASSREKPGAH